MLSKTILGIALISFSVAITLLLFEWLAHYLVDPVDFLQPQLVNDPVLGHRIQPNSGGHDAWGFRNLEVQSKYAIVAIGDSMTYGVAATRAGAWPHQLAEISGKSVYSLALGGYGPLQYLHLLRTKALSLNPDTVIVAIYLGNDLMDSSNMANSYPHWSNYRTAAADIVPPSESENVQTAHGDIRFGGLRRWLSQRSLTYSILTRSVLGDLVRRVETEAQPGILTVTNPVGMQTYLEPERRLRLLDLSKPMIKEGVVIAKASLKDIKQITDEANIKLMVLLIPTKENVFSENVEADIKPPSYHQLVRNEEMVRQDLVNWFRENNLDYVDLLLPLRDALQNETIYPVNDGHPNERGYRVIADLVGSRIR